jgi:hypothetical protein
MKLVKACIAMAAFAALFVVPSVASAIQLDAPTSTKAAGEIVGTNVAHAGTAKHTLLEGSFGSVTCDNAVVRGTLVTNGAAHVTGNIESAIFSGPTGTTECTSSLGSVTVTPHGNVASGNNPSHGGVKSLPWCITASKDEFSLRGGKCSEAERNIFFTLDFKAGFSCTYSKKAVTGITTTHPAQAIATVTAAGGAFGAPVTSSSIFCPQDGVLKMAFTLENGAGQAAFLTTV